MNKCPYCKHNLVVIVDAFNLKYDEDDNGFDTTFQFQILKTGKIKDKKIPNHIELCDKDRIIACNHCCKDSSYPYADKLMVEAYKQLKILNPSVL